MNFSNLTFYFLKAASDVGHEVAPQGGEHAPDGAGHAAEAVGHAAEAAGHGAEAFDLTHYLVDSNLLNIAIMVILLAWLVKKFNLFGGFDATREKIARDVAQVEDEKKKATKELNAIKKRTKNLSDEVEAILKEAKTSAQGLSAQILNSAQSEAAKIVDASKSRMELEEKAAMKALEAKVLSEALSLAREDLAKNMTKSDQVRSVEQFLEELPSAK